ncbi:MAG: GvpL/GvpF family gas vesicle protein [Methanotrichaceae archaeon]|nr:GvpL/GvpF family gas vesicle protein [Methanotrichaceae archaeon]
MVRKVRRQPGEGQDSGKYVYCVVRSTGEKESFGEIGYDGSEVYTLDYRDFSPVVSDSPFKEYGMDESEVEVHRNVIQWVMKDHDVLPVAYGMAFKSRKLLTVAMSAGYEAMKKAIRVVEGKHELGIKVFLPKGVLTDSQEEISKVYREGLQEIASDHKDLSLFSERLLMNTAFLVERGRIDEFSARVGELSERYGDLKVQYSGPWPPYNFVDIHILGKKRKGFR